MSRKTAKADVIPVRQQNQYNCMTTSLAMALRAQGVPDEECGVQRVNKVVGAMPLRGAAWEPLLAAANHFGMRATLTLPSTVRQLKQWTDAGTPVVIAWNPENREWSHASLVFDVDDDLNVYVADPNIPDPDETVRVVPKAEFYGKWYEKSPQGFLIRRPACAIQREITADGRQVMASAKRVASLKTAQWKPLFDGKGKKYITDDLRVYVSPEDVWETVRDRDVPDLYEVADPEMLADGIPELIDAYENAERDHAKWVRQGWWPRPEKVQKWRIYVTHRPTKKNFESKGLYDSEREALRMADIAIPKIQARRRPRWLVPDSDNEAATMRSAKKTKRKDRTTEIREKKDKSKVKVKFTPGGGRNPHAEDALSRKPTRGHKRKERARAVGKGHSRKQKHKGQRAYASAARVATMFMLKDKE